MSAPLEVIWTENRAKRGKREVCLPNSEIDLLFILHREWPNAANKQTILSGMFGAKGPQFELDCLKVHIYRLRKNVAPLGIEIRNVCHTGGYQLVIG